MRGAALEGEMGSLNVNRQVGGVPYTREQRGADLLLLLLLLLSLSLSLLLCTKSETPWTGRSESCPTTCQNEVGAPANKLAKPTLRYLCYLLFKPERLGVRFYKHAAPDLSSVQTREKQLLAFDIHGLPTLSCEEVRNLKLL